MQQSTVTEEENFPKMTSFVLLLLLLVACCDFAVVMLSSLSQLEPSYSRPRPRGLENWKFLTTMRAKLAVEEASVIDISRPCGYTTHTQHREHTF